MTGGPARATWHTFEADPHELSATNGAKRLIADGNEVHFCFNPISGQTVQILSADRAGRGLVNKSGGVETNRMGTRNIQVEVIAYAKDPFTSHLTEAGQLGLWRLVSWMRTQGIPDVWPVGSPPKYDPKVPMVSKRSAYMWTHFPGHFPHSEVPENTHGDPGAVDTRKFFPPSAATVHPDDYGDDMLYYFADDKSIRLAVVKTDDDGKVRTHLVHITAAVWNLHEPTVSQKSPFVLAIDRKWAAKAGMVVDPPMS